MQVHARAPLRLIGRRRVVATSAIALLRRAVAFFKRYGVRVQRVMTDNGSAYRAHKHRLACHQLALKHLFTQPYRPRPNGKAERFIQTLINDWGRGRLHAKRTKAPDAWLNHHNFRRPHASLSHKPPGSRPTKAPKNYI